MRASPLEGFTLCLRLPMGTSDTSEAMPLILTTACPGDVDNQPQQDRRHVTFTWHGAAVVGSGGDGGKTQPWSPTKSCVCVDTEDADTWQGHPTLSPPRSVVSSAHTSSTLSTNVVDSIGMPHRQLRTALLSERLGGGTRTQRAFSDVNSPFLQPEFLAQAAELIGLESTSVVTSPEKTAPRLPAKKRKFDWGERSNGDISQSSVPTTSSSQQQLLASLIVDKPAQLEPTRRSSVCTITESSGLTGSSGSMFSYPIGVPAKQRKLSYPDLSFSNAADAFSSFRPSPNASAFSARNEGEFPVLFFCY
ncbi:unnamed protein product [Rodentolepis nana]|uniref:Uncharacterized protein n=1 Tax=Rodentolepis nana TaxID=102285 RepID=A0A0R3TDJ2_RODNA|nr:unnamed protein product [Rodentolepis nana]